MLILNIMLLAILIILSALFSSSETAIFSLSPIKARNLTKLKKRGAKSLDYIKKNQELTLVAILIANNLVNISASAVATLLAVDFFGSTGIGIAIGAITFLILLFGEITPKSLALQYNVQLALFLSPIIKVVIFLTYPISKLFLILTAPFISKKAKQELSEEELRQIVSLGREEGLINKRISSILKNVLDFKENTAADIMTPASAVITIDSEEKLSDAMHDIVKYRFSRYPIFDDDKDEVIGVIFSDEILEHISKKSTNVKIRELAKKTFYVPETAKIETVLEQFQSTEHDIAIVLNEYGAFIGIITLHNILEDLVGDIFDRKDRKSIYIKKINKSRAIIDARASLDEINDVLHLGLRDSHFNTIAGLVQHKLGRMPSKGDEIKLHTIKIKVIEAQEHKIKKLLVTHK